MLEPLPWLADDVLGWPRPVRWILWGLSPVVVLAADWQRRGGVMPLWALLLASSLALLPCLVDRVPRLAGLGMVLVSVVLYMSWPVDADVAPFLLVLMALEEGVRRPLG